MRKFAPILVISLIISFFLSCDGRERIHKSPETVLKENKLMDSFSETITYIPNVYSEKVTDTILSNGFKIKIKSYTDMNNGVTKTIKKDTITEQLHYRNIKNEVIVFKNDVVIFNKILNTSFFLKHVKTLGEYKDKATSLAVNIDTTRFINKNEIRLTAGFCVPESTNCLIYTITIQADGSFRLEEIEK